MLIVFQLLVEMESKRQADGLDKLITVLRVLQNSSCVDTNQDLQ